MNTTPRLVSGLVLVLLCASTISADDKAETMKLLVGKWETKRKLGEREARGEMEFTAAGKVTMKVKRDKGDATFLGTYKLIDAGNIEITFMTIAGDTTDQSKIKVTKETLELTDKKGQTRQLTRLK
jgi:uncharacterized protein (TIGR03066 family)